MPIIGAKDKIFAAKELLTYGSESDFKFFKHPKILSNFSSLDKASPTSSNLWHAILRTSPSGS